MGGETQYISQHNTLYPHCGMGGETQYISQHNTLDPHCGMGGRHNIFPNTIHWIHIAEWEGDTIYFLTQYIGSTLWNGRETQYISQHNTLDPHCGMGGRHNIF